MRFTIKHELGSKLLNLFVIINFSDYLTKCSNDWYYKSLKVILCDYGQLSANSLTIHTLESLVIMGLEK